MTVRSHWAEFAHARLECGHTLVLSAQTVALHGVPSRGWCATCRASCDVQSHEIKKPVAASVHPGSSGDGQEV